MTPGPISMLELRATWLGKVRELLLTMLLESTLRMQPAKSSRPPNSIAYKPLHLRQDSSNQAGE
jgi:hypothetical protein